MKTLFLDKLPSIGAIVAAAGCPICFPALAAVGSAFGLGALAAYENQFLILTQALIGLSMIFATVSYRRTRNKISLLIALLSGTLFFFAWHILGNTPLIYLGLGGVFATAMWNLYLEKRTESCRI